MKIEVIYPLGREKMFLKGTKVILYNFGNTNEIKNIRWSICIFIHIYNPGLTCNPEEL